MREEVRVEAALWGDETQVGWRRKVRAISLNVRTDLEKSTILTDTRKPER